MTDLDRKKVYHLNTLSDVLPNDIDGSVYIYFDPFKIVYKLLKSESKNNKYIFLGIANGDRETLIRGISKILKDYDRSPNIRCKSYILNTYGKKGLIDKAMVKEMDNPYYKCAEKMKMYDINVIKALMDY